MPEHASSLELWAGAECTVNRVHDQYFDQLQRTGHDQRLDDLHRLAALGARRIRFPVLWERCAPSAPDTVDFSWSDVRLQRLVGLGMAPIVGLCHHGSGPAYTSLISDHFPEQLGRFAAKVAAQYPFVEAYTPVNEPLTTARFSALYGHWYPHERQLGAFLKALVNEVLATRESMRAIRRVNPRAELVQTEDIGRVFATPPLQYQAAYENDRRWLSLDLLCGRVDPQHPMRRHLEENGIPARTLDDLVAEPCIPDLIGVNYYVTSDRFLDHRVHLYPSWTVGGNGRDTYADVEAVRAMPEGILGHRAVLEEVWDRYRRPCAITEVQLACHREEQVRWFWEAWAGARAARQAGVDVRAVTLWSAFGADGWNNLVTRATGQYEPGPYDVRSPMPRPTALATLIPAIATGCDRDVPFIRTPGWWRREGRLLYGISDQNRRPQDLGSETILVVGTGWFADRVVAAFARRFPCVAVPRLTSSAADAALSNPALFAVVLANDPARSPPMLQTGALARLSRLARKQQRSLRVLAFSSDRVFDGHSTRPYVERDRTATLDANGLGWLRLERAVFDMDCRSLVIRAGLLMDPEYPKDVLATALAELQSGRSPKIEAMTRVSPTYVPHLLDTALDLLVDDEQGLWHLAPRTDCSLVELTSSLAERVGVSASALRPDRRLRPIRRGHMRALASERGWLLPDVSEALDAYAATLGGTSSLRARAS